MYVWGVKNAQCKCNFAVFSTVSENEPIELQNKTSPMLNGVNLAKLRDTRFFDNSVWPKVGPPETQCPILNYAFSFTYVTEDPMNFICAKFQLVVSISS